MLDPLARGCTQHSSMRLLLTREKSYVPFVSAR